MKIPYANRTVDIDLPSVEGQPKITVKGIIDDFSKQLPENFNTLLEAFVLLSPRRVRVTCRSPRAMEEFCHSGLSFNSHPITIRPCKTAKWVTLSRLSYGIPEDAIRETLACYGRVIHVKMDSYRGVYIGTRNILMDISTPIPSRVRIAGHWCHIFYPGQTPTCFSCHKSGHAQKECPNRNEAMDATEHHQVTNTTSDPPQSPRANGAVDPIKVQAESSATETSKMPTSPARQGGDHPTGDKPLAPADDSALDGKTPSDTPAREKENAAQCNIEADDRIDDEEDKSINVQECMDATSGSNKRDRADDYCSDDSEGHQEKRGKSLLARIPLSPNRFAALVDEAANVPLPAPDDNEFSSPAINLPSSNSTPGANVTNTPVNDSFSENESLTSDLHLDNANDPEHVDDLTSPAVDSEILDSPREPIIPNIRRMEATSQSSSSSRLDCFTMGIISKRTRPAPVVGSRRKTSM